MPQRNHLLQVEGLEKRFGGLVAVSDYNLTLEKGELVGLIGPNGAGRTAVLNLLSGFIKPGAGKVTLNAEEITSLPPHRYAFKGIARTFQKYPGVQSFKCLGQ